MGAFFASASSQRLTTTGTIPLPSTGYPFTIGFWHYPTTVASASCFALSDPATANFISVGRNGTNVPNMNLNAGAGGAANSLTTALTTNTWNYYLARFITSTNRWLSVLHFNGLIETVQGTTARAPTGLTNLNLGSRNDTAAPSTFMDGLLGEYFLTDTDIQADGATTQNSLILQLAYGGPFSVPHIAQDIMEYHSLYSTLDTPQENLTEVYYGIRRITWVNTNGVTIGQHPSLPGNYIEPGQIKRQLVV